MQATVHFEERLRQRRISDEMVRAILRYGSDIPFKDVHHYTVREVDLPLPLRSTPLSRSLRDVVIVLTRDDTLVTVYRKERAYRKLKKRVHRYHWGAYARQRVW